ncbi:maltase A1-like [Mizuhopecten yessoensis]|uniref:Maltase H n=1 Tax=Mizuhopecten yessoensis TaxID=6573 RepID=A0A210PPS1_MIZYE|nr:maltase A1-like [Mizuhopecten yessoensis]XP_021378336.1 maltase A1-like [Mizuhopecten yessoensis]OWF38499.1 maltase H [Mizuhopecten yessoensis]
MDAEGDPKEHCCSKTRCSVIVFAFLLVSVAVLCVVTFTGDVRKRVQYDTSDLQWWKTTPVYQIYPRSFKDTNGDGDGDLNGITEKLSYLSYLGIKAVWISPFYKSPMKDSGYDISNYTEVDPRFGTMDDFDRLLEEAKKKDIKVIIDFVPNHTSNESEWFVDSENREEGYDDFYVWVNGTSGTPPNNWKNTIGNSAWTWSDKRQQYYYHNYLIEQPDLNYRNPNVISVIQDVMRFWLDKGVAGFRIDAVVHLFESENLHDQVEEDGKTIQNETVNLPEIFPVIQGWKKLLDTYSDPPRVMFSETTSVDKDIVKKYYDAGTIPFNFDLVKKVNRTCDGSCMRDVIKEYTKETLRSDDWPNFLTGSHDFSRVATRLGENRARAMAMLLLTLPGTPVIYYGEEIGMTDVHYTFNESRDTFGLRLGKDGYLSKTRDPERSPMQWTSGVKAGFTNQSVTPWLHLSSEYATVNVQVLKANASGILQLYKNLIETRRHPSFETNTLEFAVVTSDILSYVRNAEGWQTHLVVINLGSKSVTHDFSSGPVFSTKGKVAITTDDSIQVGQDVDLSSVSVGSNQGIVVAVTYQEH